MKTVKITPPDGYEIDREKSTLEEIVFKPIKKMNVITNLVVPNTDIEINHEWAFSIFPTEDQGNKYEGKRRSGHQASLFLCISAGQWFDSNGNTIMGYLYFKPAGE